MESLCLFSPPPLLVHCGFCVRTWVLGKESERVRACVSPGYTQKTECGPTRKEHLISDSSAIISCRAGSGLARLLQISYCCSSETANGNAGYGQAQCASATKPSVALGDFGGIGGSEFVLRGNFGAPRPSQLSLLCHRLCPSPSHTLTFCH
jgi:hypothetical protein